MSTQRKSLGKGLSSIIKAGVKTPELPRATEKKEEKSDFKSVKIAAHGLFSEIPTDKIDASKFQARSVFDETAIAELADSIASEGLLQPVLVRQTKDGRYELLAGERRFRACQKLGLKKVVACVQNVSDASAAIKGLIENIQRADLNPMEEAKGIASLMANFKLTQDAVAQRLGKPRSSITNTLRLLKLPQEICGYISKGLLTLGHAKVILGIDNATQQLIVARRIIESGLNVRATETLVARLKLGAERSTRGSYTETAAKSAVIADIQKKTSSKLNAKVEIKPNGKRGKIIIDYIDNDDFQRILEIIGVKI